MNKYSITNRIDSLLEDAGYFPKELLQICSVEEVISCLKDVINSLENDYTWDYHHRTNNIGEIGIYWKNSIIKSWVRILIGNEFNPRYYQTQKIKKLKLIIKKLNLLVKYFALAEEDSRDIYHITNKK